MNAPNLRAIRLAAICVAASLSSCRPAGPSSPPADAIFAPLATYADSANVSAAVRKECRVQSDLPRYAQKYTKGRVWYDPSVSPDEGLRLELVVTQIQAPFAPPVVPRSMTVRARVLLEGRSVASFEARRTTTISHAGPPPMGFTGNCQMLRRTAAAIGKDVARWLETVEVPQATPAAGPAGATSAGP